MFKNFTLLLVSFYISLLIGNIILHFIPIKPAEKKNQYGNTTGVHYTYDDQTGYALRPNIKDHLRKINTDKFGHRITPLKKRFKNCFCW